MNFNITQTLRPIRLAFLIKPNSKKAYFRAVRICSAFWGGVYFPIFALNTKFTRKLRESYSLLPKERPLKFYLNIIENFDPDFVIFDENLNADFVKKISGDRTIIPLQEVEESIYSDDVKYGICIEDILYSIKETEFKYERNDSLEIVLPRIDEKDLYAATLFGSASEEKIMKLKQIPFPKKYISFPEIQPLSYSILAGKNVLDFLKLGQQEIYTTGNSFWTSQTAIVLVKTNELRDLLLFWNLRALGWNVIAVCIKSYKDDYYKQLIKVQQKEFILKNRLEPTIKILANDINDEEVLIEICDHIENIKPKSNIHYFYHLIPRFWLERKDLSFDKEASVLIRSKTKNYSFSSNQNIQLPVLVPKFPIRHTQDLDPCFTNEISYDFIDNQAKYAQIISSIPSSEMYLVIISPFISYQHRLSENGLFFLIGHSKWNIHFTIPEAKVVFEKWLEINGYNFKSSQVGKLCNQMIVNIGGIKEVRFFTSLGILEVLSLFENGKIVNKNNLFSNLSRLRNQNQLNKQNLDQIVFQLISKNIIQFGIEIQCPFCSQNSFYIPIELKDKIKCFVCHNQFKPPFHNPDKLTWAYRGLGSFAKNNKSDGIISVFLTLYFFRIKLNIQKITSTFSFEIHNNAKEVINEIDLALFIKESNFSKPDLLFCECKTYYDFEKKDIERMEKIAKLFPGSVLVFATLKEKLKKIEKNLILSMAKKFRKGYGSRPINPILILTANELLHEYNYDKEIKDSIIKHLLFSDKIGHLSDVTTEHYLGLPFFISEAIERIKAKQKS